MHRPTALIAALALSATAPIALAQAHAPNDAQIAHIAYTAGQIDIAAGRMTLTLTVAP